MSRDPWLLGLLALALALRAFSLVAPGAAELRMDEILHLGAGVLTAEYGMRIVGHWAPGYEALLALIFSAAGPRPSAVFWVQIALSTATVGFVYGIASAAGGRRTARIAGLLAACLPSFIAYSHTLYSETLYLFLFTGGSYCLLRSAGRARPFEIAAAGLAFGLAALTRTVGVYFLPLWLGWLWWRGEHRALREGAAATLVMALVIAPWTLRNAFVYDDFLLVDGTAGQTLHIAYGGRPEPFNMDLGYGLDPSGERISPCTIEPEPGRAPLPEADALMRLFDDAPLGEIERRRLRRRLERIREFAVQDTPAYQRCEVEHATAYALAHPAKVIDHSVKRVYALWGPNSFLLRSLEQGVYPASWSGPAAYAVLKWPFVAGYLALGLAALLALGRREPSFVRHWSVGLVLYLTAMHGITIAMSRYRLPAMPFVLVLAALWLARPAWPEPSRVRAIAIGAIAFAALCIHYAITVLP